MMKRSGTSTFQPPKESETQEGWRGASSKSPDVLEKFLLLVCHQFHHPLAALEMEICHLNDKKKSLLLEHTAYLKNLINILFRYFRLGSQHLSFHTIDSSKVLKKALGNIRHLVEENDVLVLYKTLPKVYGNELLLIQLFQNLLVNAIQYRSRKKPRVWLQTSKTRDGFALFSFLDNGIGIKPQYAQEVFLPFRRIGSSNHNSGLGMGLAFAKKIVEIHGRKIWVESEPGKGSNFCFTLPFTKIKKSEKNQKNSDLQMMTFRIK